MFLVVDVGCQIDCHKFPLLRKPELKPFGEIRVFLFHNRYYSPFICLIKMYRNLHSNALCSFWKRNSNSDKKNIYHTNKVAIHTQKYSFISISEKQAVLRRK